MQIKLMILLLMLMGFTGCSKYDFDGFDPSTSVVKWVLKNKGEEKNDNQ
jgi:hypothetical protein